MKRKSTKQGMGGARVWLRSRATNLFFSHTGQWVTHRNEAFDFKDVQKALICGKTSGIASLEVILETRRGDFPVPITNGSFPIHRTD